LIIQNLPMSNTSVSTGEQPPLKKRRPNNKLEVTRESFKQEYPPARVTSKKKELDLPDYVEDLFNKLIRDRGMFCGDKLYFTYYEVDINARSCKWRYHSKCFVRKEQGTGLVKVMMKNGLWCDVFNKYVC